MDIIVEKINKAFANLSQEKVLAMSRVDIEKLKSEIISKYNIGQEKAIILDNNITFVLIGLMTDFEFKSFVREKLEISPDKINIFTNEIYEKIFDKINHLSNLFLENKHFSSKETEVFTPTNETRTPSKNISPDSNFQTKIYEIGRKYGLLIDQIGKLDEITNKVISGDISSARYEDELRARLAISPDLLANIIKDVNEQIFNKIRQSIRNYFENKENDKNDLIEDDIPTPPYKEKVADVPSNLPIKEEPKIIPQEKDPSVSNNTEQKNKETETIVTQPKELPTGIEITPIDENMGQIKEEKQASTPQENQIPMTANPISTQTTLAPNPTPNNPNNSVFAKTGIEILDTTSQSGFDPYKEVL